jgi:hypothetical protein
MGRQPWPELELVPARVWLSAVACCAVREVEEKE